MSLGENLQFLRKRNNITQEQLAEKLNISRQSISKWESDTAYPEMDKLLQLSELYKCSMDDLLKKDISTLYVEDKTDYDSHINTFSRMIALGVGLILFGLSVNNFLYGININTNIADAVFFAFIIIAVAIFVVMGMRHDQFKEKNKIIEDFYTEEEKDAFNKKFSVFIATGIVLILIGVLIIMCSDSVLSENTFNTAYDIDALVSGVFFLFITAAVYIFVYFGLQKGKYNIKEYNDMNDKKSEAYKKANLTGTICGCLMMIATIIYLICGFVFGEWGMPSVVVFPVFGIGCGIVSIIIDAKNK